MKKLFLNTISFVLLLLTLECKAQEVKPINPITDLPKEIKYRYSQDLIPNTESAIKISKIILKNYFNITNFDNLTSFEVKLVADNKVWEIESRTKGKTVTGISK